MHASLFKINRTRKGGFKRYSSLLEKNVRDVLFLRVQGNRQDINRNPKSKRNRTKDINNALNRTIHTTENLQQLQ